MATAFDAMTDATAPQIERALSGIMRDMIGRYRAEQPILLPGDARERVEAVLASTYRTAMAMGGEPMIEGLKGCFPHLERKATLEELFEQLIAYYIEQFGALAVTQIVETTRAQISRVILAGQEEGLSIEQIAATLREAVPEFSRLRSRIIARTETHGSSQFAQLGVARTSAFALNKAWNSVEDYRTRDFNDDGDGIDDFNHRVMDGVSVELELPFMVPRLDGGAEAMMYPGDRNGSAANVINCRCAMTFRRRDRKAAWSLLGLGARSGACPCGCGAVGFANPLDSAILPANLQRDRHA